MKFSPFLKFFIIEFSCNFEHSPKLEPIVLDTDCCLDLETAMSNGNLWDYFISHIVASMQPGCLAADDSAGRPWRRWVCAVFRLKSFTETAAMCHCDPLMT